MKQFYTLFLILSTFFLSAQVGIGTISPRGALDINEPTTNNKGLVLPINSSPSQIINPQSENIVPGTIFFDKTEDCIKIYREHKTGGTSEPGWSNCIGYPANSDNGGDPDTFSKLKNTCNTGDVQQINNDIKFTNDPIRQHLSSSLSTYDAAAVGDLVYITKEEYEKMSEASKKLGKLYFTNNKRPSHSASTSVNLNDKYEATTTNQYPKVNVFAFAARSPVAQDIVFKLFSDVYLYHTTQERIGVVWRSNRIPIREGDNYLVFKKSAASFNYTAKNKNSNKKAKLILGHYADTPLYVSSLPSGEVMIEEGDKGWDCNKDNKGVNTSRYRPEIAALYFVE